MVLRFKLGLGMSSSFLIACFIACLIALLLGLLAELVGFGARLLEQCFRLLAGCRQLR